MWEFEFINDRLGPLGNAKSAAQFLLADYSNMQKERDKFREELLNKKKQNQMTLKLLSLQMAKDAKSHK